jgi:thiol-disulfide isomerase/thioredoxin
MPFPFVLLLALALPQTTSNAPKPDALALLTEVSQQYADAKSYHIEAVEERATNTELSRNWQKTLLTAIVMPGGRHHYEGRSSYGSATLVSDGATQWDYHPYDRLYTRQPSSPKGPETTRIVTQEEGPLLSAREIVNQMRHRAGNLKSATTLPDETISVNGNSVACQVVHYSDEDFKKKRKDSPTFEWTVWIDKSRKVVIKTYKRGETYLMTTAHGRIPMHEETTVTYPVVELDQQEPAASFTFVPPTDAKLVAEFPGTEHPPQEVDMTGKPAPELQFKSSDGKITALSSFRGKPVFIEFWATWCEPCLDLMPDLANLYSETAGKGLGWLSFDNDEGSGTAAEFISREHIPWPNYHDEDGSLGKAFHRMGIPLGVLIDAEGKVTFYKAGYEIADLRNAIAKLGPQFSSIAPAGTYSK